MTSPRITVVIPSFNRSKYISKAIKSVMNQTYTGWKLLIIDDASTDDTVEKIKPFLKDRRIELGVLPKNVGISHVMNLALTKIDTEAFVQLDSDDWLEKDALQLFAKAMDKDPDAALYYGNIRMWLETNEGKKTVYRYIKHRSFNNKYEFLCYMTYMLHPRCYRTEAVRSVKGWDTSDPYEGRVMEDRRMCVKLIEKYPFCWINKVLYNRRKHKNQLTDRRRNRIRNQLRKQLVLTSLKRWGDHYRPVFGKRGGLLIVRKLIEK